MSLQNITYDDFSSNAFSFSSNWNVPDTSQRNYEIGNSFLESLVDYTYHETNTINSSFTVNFTGSAFYLYGLSGPGQGSYSVKLDSSPTSLPVSAYASTNKTNYLLYSTSNLNPTTSHSVLVTNLGAGLLVDYALGTSIVGAIGSTAVNTTVEDDSNLVTYSGMWSSNNDTRFSGNTSSFTNTDGGSASITFHGSQVYVYGDTVIDHGVYQINLDNLPPTQYNGKTTDLKINTLKYFASNLNSSLHTLKITNIGSTFFDLDRIVYTTPSVYYVAPTPSNTTSATSSTTGSITAPASSGSSLPSNSTATTTASKGNNAGSRFCILSSVYLGIMAVIVHLA